jgi:hypothetical protein
MNLLPFTLLLNNRFNIDSESSLIPPPDYPISTLSFNLDEETFFCSLNGNNLSESQNLVFLTDDRKKEL